MAAGLYVHLPFCRSKCAYCDFVSRPGLEHLMPAYVAALGTECALYEDSPDLRVIGSVYLGGGTPSLLPPELLRQVLQLRERFPADGPLEVTMEANPGTLDRARLEVFAAGGGTRLSLGLQSHDAALLRLLGRIHTAADVTAQVGAARAAGIARINLDLIYGLPGQTVESWRQTLSFALSLAPDHLSLYDLELHENTPLAGEVAAGRLTLPSEEETAAMLSLAMDKLPAAGLYQYEVASFAVPGAESRHNLNYWRLGKYLGLGAAAHSHLGRKRRANLADPAEYVAALARGAAPVAWEEELTDGDELLEAVMLGLRLREGIDLNLLARRFGRAAEILGPALPGLCRAGLLTADGGRLRLTEAGIPLADHVLRTLVTGPGSS